MLALPGKARRWEPKRLRLRIFTVAGRITRSGRRLRLRLAVVNTVLEFLRLPQLDADTLPPVRYGKQADGLTERHVDLVRSAMNSPG